MGNRAVIVTKDTTFQNQQTKVGIYLHWCGSEDSVKEFLTKAKQKGIRNPNDDSEYGWARLCQIICDEFSADGNHDVSVGIGIVSHLDTNNFDNGVYYIDENWNIVNHTDGSELNRDYEGAKKLFDFYKQGSAGSFHTALLDAWSKADNNNRERLAIAFPELAYAIKEDEGE